MSSQVLIHILQVIYFDAFAASLVSVVGRLCKRGSYTPTESGAKGHTRLPFERKCLLASGHHSLKKRKEKKNSIRGMFRKAEKYLPINNSIAEVLVSVLMFSSLLVYLELLYARYRPLLSLQSVCISPDIYATICTRRNWVRQRSALPI